MEFEVEKTDLDGRLGKLYFKRGEVETPTLLPVVSPLHQSVPASKIYDMGFPMVITSAYLLSKHFDPSSLKIHDLLKTKGIIMMDSGAYQILQYGDIELTPQESIAIQESVGADLGVILDMPISLKETRDEAEFKINETIKRVTEAYFQAPDTNWTLPLQGGRRLDLLESYISKTAEYLPKFDFVALGSVTQLMSTYKYTPIIKMIQIARRNVPSKYPLHLFGAGHPMMFSLAVAMGADTFDSAAYILYAKDGRYLTSTGTLKLENLKEFPCVCPVCISNTPKDLQNADRIKQMELLALHNLYVSLFEIKLIRESIRANRLWDLVQLRAAAHPSLFKAVREPEVWENVGKCASISVSSRIKTLSEFDYNRPVFRRFREFIETKYNLPSKAKILNCIIIPTNRQPADFLQTIRVSSSRTNEFFSENHIVGLIPLLSAVPFEFFESTPAVSIVSPGFDETTNTEFLLDSLTSFYVKHNFSELKVFIPTLVENTRFVKEIEKRFGEDKIFSGTPMRQKEEDSY